MSLLRRIKEKPKSLVVASVNEMAEHTWGEMESILSEYAQKLNRQIVVTYHKLGAIAYPHSEPGKLFLYLFSAPGRSSKIKIPRIYDHFLGGHEAYTPAGNGVLMLDNEGTPVAEITTGSISVLINPPVLTSILMRSVMRLIFDDYLFFLDDPDGFREKNEKFSELHFVSSFQTEIGNLVTKSALAIKDAENKIADHQKAIFELVKKRQEAIRTNSLANTMLQNEDIESIKKKLEAIKLVPGVREVVVTAFWIRVMIEWKVVIAYMGTRYFIGREFELMIYPDGSSGFVRLLNKTQIVESHHHPHISHDGWCCLGNISGPVAQLIAEGKFDLVVMLMIEFLSSINPGGWYKTIEYWPVEEEWD